MMKSLDIFLPIFILALFTLSHANPSTLLPLQTPAKLKHPRRTASAKQQQGSSAQPSSSAETSISRRQVTSLSPTHHEV
ncbi:hypothetical protein L873DRAFT_1813390 [Choiromyces venosus 120613-1]|uniref:Uncharacterized protein n=1 Tax=Choiromyces venosus 120613-1 TaxID=1336337 RepID=A0A3N4JEC7_9PEZI|nr:hypothetical protein L873DRAFT_1813390 [Choiromyces venosus 120613-1]